jgi:hypothetical protein
MLSNSTFNSYFGTRRTYEYVFGTTISDWRFFGLKTKGDGVAGYSTQYLCRVSMDPEEDGGVFCGKCRRDGLWIRSLC